MTCTRQSAGEVPHRYLGLVRPLGNVRDLQHDLTDLTSFVVMQDVRLTYVLTDDVHFSRIGMGFQTLPERTEKRR